VDDGRHCNPLANKAIRKAGKGSLKTWTIAIRATVFSKGHNLILLSYRQQLAIGGTKEAAIGAQPGDVYS
jgi:hypothetical protein